MQAEVNEFLTTPLFTGSEEDSWVYPEIVSANTIVVDKGDIRTLLVVTILYK